MPLKGYKQTAEHSRKIREATTDLKRSKETCLKISEAKKGIPRSEETKRKVREFRLGKKASKETKQKMSEDRQGKNHWNWQGGITTKYHQIRTSYETNQWRVAVFERDNYTCQKCGDKKGHNLNAHHIKSFSKYPELRFEISNGLTVCEICHDNINKKQKELKCAS